MSGVTRALRAFGHFWWEFVVGDTPELAAAAAVVVGLAFLVADDHAVGVGLVPAVTTAFLGFSTYRGRRRTTVNRRGVPGAGLGAHDHQPDPSG